jgi:hypothetical protein
VLVPDPPLVVVVTLDETEDTAAGALDVAEVVVWASDVVTLLTVETTVETTLVGLGGGGGGGDGCEVDVGSGGGGGSGTVVVETGRDVVGSGTEVLVGSGTVVVVRSDGGPSASAVGAATAAAAAQSRIDLAHRPLTGIQPRGRANGFG